MKVRSISPDYRKNTQDERKYGPSAVSAGKEGGLHRGPVSLSDIREKGVSIWLDGLGEDGDVTGGDGYSPEV